MKRQDLGVLALLVVATGLVQRPVASADPFLPNFAAAVFNDSLDIDNPYFPLVPGTAYLYRSEATDGTNERNLVEVLHDTKTVMGVETRVVRDRVWLEHPMFGDLIIEDTYDWYAQDDAGNVWYMGEYVTDHLYDALGMETGVDHAGSWEAGLDVAMLGQIAKPGFIMEASPAVPDFYFQEQYPGEAEDQAEVLALGQMINIPYGMYTNVLQTEETTALDPDALEHKYYAPGVGKILDYVLDPDTEEILATTTLISIVPEPGTLALVVLGGVGLLLVRPVRGMRACRTDKTMLA